MAWPGPRRRNKSNKEEVKDFSEPLRVGPETRALLIELQAIVTELREIRPKPYKEVIGAGEWEIQRYGKENYEIYPSENNNFRIVGDGVAHRLSIPFAHKWLIMFMTHRDNSDALTTGTLNTEILIPYWRHSQQLVGLPGRWSDKEGSRPMIIFPEQWEYPPSIYEITFTSGVSTNRVYPVILVRRLG